VVRKNSRTPSGSTGNNRKIPNKRAHVDSPLGSVSSDQAQLSELARVSREHKSASIEMKHRKMELAAEEKALQIKKQMQETELMYQERMMRMQLEIARLKGGQAPVTSGDHYTGLYRRVTQRTRTSTAFPNLRLPSVQMR